MENVVRFFIKAGTPNFVSLGERKLDPGKENIEDILRFMIEKIKELGIETVVGTEWKTFEYVQVVYDRSPEVLGRSIIAISAKGFLQGHAGIIIGTGSIRDVSGKKIMLVT